MKELQQELTRLFQNLKKDTQIIEKINQEDTIFPFSRESRLMAYLLSVNAITYDKYDQILQAYTQRNRYLSLFEMPPRTFGETWGETHILTLFPQFIKATRENMASLYPNFDGEFDLWLSPFRIEVKACRANSNPKKNSQSSLVSRAYLHKEAKEAGFKYHFQQLKPSCCDVFIWIGVCRDDLIYWVLTSQELERTGKLGPQHRTEHTGKDGFSVFEGQVFMTEEELRPFLTAESDLLATVRSKADVNQAHTKTDFLPSGNP